MRTNEFVSELKSLISKLYEQPNYWKTCDYKCDSCILNKIIIDDEYSYTSICEMLEKIYNEL